MQKSAHIMKVERSKDERERNENGDCFLDLCRENNLIIGSDHFSTRDIHKATWKSSNNKMRNQIDHTASNRGLDAQIHSIQRTSTG